MGFNRIPAITTQRGQHPDLDENGYVRPEAFLYSDERERDFNLKFSSDPTFATNFMERVANRQRELPEYVQHQVAGQLFGEGQGAYAGLREYQRKVEELRRDEDDYTYGADKVVVRDHELEDMPMSRYDELFDSNGQPKPGVVLERTRGTSVSLDDGIDPWSAREMRSNRP